MKSTEELALEFSRLRSPKETKAIISQIQLDAMREGMQRASEICLPKTKREYLLSESACKQRILSAAEQLTEKDL